MQIIHRTCPNAPLPRSAPRRYFPKSVLAISPLTLAIAGPFAWVFGQDILQIEKISRRVQEFLPRISLKIYKYISIFSGALCFVPSGRKRVEMDDDEMEGVCRQLGNSKFFSGTLVEPLNNILNRFSVTNSVTVTVSQSQSATVWPVSVSLLP